MMNTICYHTELDVVTEHCEICTVIPVFMQVT